MSKKTKASSSASRQARRREKAMQRQARSGTGQPQFKHQETAKALEIALRLRDRQELDEALSIATQALGVEPSNPTALMIVGTIHHQAGRLNEALTCYEKAHEFNKKDVGALGHMAECLAQLRLWPQCFEVYSKALQLSPKNVDLRRAVAAKYLSLKNYTNALVHQLVIIDEKPTAFDYTQLAQSYDALEQVDQAVSSYRKAINYGAKPGDIHAAIGRIYASHNQPQNALSHLLQALDHDANNPHAYYELMHSLPKTVLPNDIETKLNDALAHHGDDSNNRVSFIHYAAGKHAERKHEWTTAFAAYSRANKCVHEPGMYRQELERPILAEQSELVRMAGNFGVADVSPLPIFVGGLPRSGTTLVATMLARHTDVSSAGELEAIADLLPAPQQVTQQNVDWARQSYARVLSTGDQQIHYVVDKSLSLYLYFGVVSVLFPQAKIIHCNRHPLDTLVSIFAQRFHPKAVSYSFSLEDCIEHMLFYEDVMKSWRELAGDRFIDVYYEDLVNDQQRVGRQMISHLGLDWQDGCLNDSMTSGVVRTASLAQVRQPVYQSSVNRWRHYDAMLGDAKRALKPLIAKYEDRKQT